MNITQLADAEGGHDQTERKQKFVELLAKVESAKTSTASLLSQRDDSDANRREASVAEVVITDTPRADAAKA
jgi:hypothetical protein